MSSEQKIWGEQSSERYREICAVTVPARAEQMATLLTLLPFGGDESFRAVELGCGEGYLTQALLECFPNASVLALDGSSSMLDQATARLSPFGARASVRQFDLASQDWHGDLRGAGCVLSSLCIHHLRGDDKRRLCEVAFEKLADRGALLLADLVEPQRREARELFAAQWDRAARAGSLELLGTEVLYHKFLEAKWNYYRFPDPVDRPSGLFEQLVWLREAGFECVDCFWLKAGHAIYGGYKGGPPKTSKRVGLEAALHAAQAALSDHIQQPDLA